MINEVLRLGNKIEKLKEIVDKSNKIVFFTGAVYRLQVVYLISVQWVDYLMKFQKGYSPEYLLSVDHLNDNKESFIDFYHKRLLVADKT